MGRCHDFGEFTDQHPVRMIQKGRHIAPLACERVAAGRVANGRHSGIGGILLGPLYLAHGFATVSLKVGGKNDLLRGLTK